MWCVIEYLILHSCNRNYTPNYHRRISTTLHFGNKTLYCALTKIIQPYTFITLKNINLIRKVKGIVTKKIIWIKVAHIFFFTKNNFEYNKTFIGTHCVIKKSLKYVYIFSREESSY